MRKRISKYKHLHSNRFRYLSSSIPLACASGLLVTLGFMLCPIQNRNASAEGEVSSEEAPDTSETVVSEESASDSTGPMKQTRGASTVSIALDDPKAINLKADAVTDEVAYISTGFTVTASNNYNIYVQTANSSSDLTNGTSVVRSITGNNIAPASFTDNTWGYTVADNKPTASTLTYNAIPTSTTNAIKSGTGAVTNKQFTLAFAAKFGSSATAGHYKTGIVLSVAANPGEVTTFYSVSYSTNGTTGGATPATQTAESSSNTYTFTLPQQGDLVKTGYKFLGWAESGDALTAQYAPGATISLSAASPVKTLYAIWGITYSLTYNANGGSNPPSMQNYDTAATSHTFTVAAKGSITKSGYTFLGWAESSGATSAQYTAGSGQITLSSSSPSKTLYAVWQKITLLTITNMNELTTAICQASTQGNSKALRDTSTGNNNKSYIVTKLKDNNCWMTENMNNSTGRSYVDSVYGGYYDYSNATSVCTQVGGGWKLPTQGQYSALVNGLNSSSIQGNPYNFKMGGYVNSGSLASAGSGYYRSSTAGGGSSAWALYFDSSNVNPGSGNFDRYFGMSVRCLVQGS